MYEGHVRKLRSQNGREVYIIVLETKKYHTPIGERTFVKYYQVDLDFETESVYEDSLQYVQNNYFAVDDLPEEVKQSCKIVK